VNLVFIHGAGSSSNVWTFQKRSFPDHRITLIDLPGHGERAGEGGDSIEAYARDVRKDIESLEDVVLIGHSMGGAITMCYALQYQVKACVLAATGARLRVLPAILAQIRERYEETVDLILNYALYNKEENIVKRSRDEMLKIPPDTMYGDFLACDRFDVIQNIGELRIPTLIICGREDMLAPLKFSNYLAAKIEPSTLEIIDDCGHMLMLERPHKFNKILEQFLRRLL
jgi:pimeloyl-ACP methyl ester carboxylesterase